MLYTICVLIFYSSFFFSSRRRHTRSLCDWSSDVCSSDLSLWRYVPSKPVALIGLGITPFLVRLFPAGLKPDPDSAPQTVTYGVLCTTLMLLTGVSGPIFDSFFLGGRLDRRAIVA